MALRFLAAAAAVAVAPAAAQDDWQKYVVGPSTPTVHPVSIVSTSGNVTNPEGLLPNGTAPAVLTRSSSSDDVPQVVIDFGLNTVGFLSIAFAGATANSPGIRLAFSETQQYLTNASDFTRSDNGDTITPGTDQIAVQSGAYTWTDANGCASGSQVCADGLHGFRYLRVYLDALDADAPLTQPNGTVQIGAVSLNYTGLIDDYRGWFECSDTNLTQWWFDGAYTNEMVTDTFRASDVDPRNSASPGLIGKQVLFDGAKRDRDPYVGDIAVSGLTQYLTHFTGDPAKNVLADLADNQRSDGWIPPASINDYTLPLFDYPYWWAVTSWEYVMFTGDTAYAQTYYPNMVLLLNTWSPSITDPSSNLLSKGLNNTGGYGDYAFLGRSDEVTYYNALYVLALQAGASMATALGNSADASSWLSRAGTVAASINANLWDASTGAYLDSSSGGSRHGQDGNSLAVLAGVANATYAASAMSYWSTLAHPYGNPFMDDDSLVSDGTDRVYAFLSFFEISARFVAGDSAGALDEIRRLYGWMATNDPGITFWEGISTGGSLYEQGYTSCAHGWSTGVVPALSQYVLGVMPTGVGFSNFTVKPYPGDLTWAKGQVPTPAGNIAASWSVDGSGGFAMNLTVPTGTSCDLSVPVSGQNPTVTLDGTAADTTASGGYVTMSNVSAGDHTVSASSS